MSKQGPFLRSWGDVSAGRQESNQDRGKPAAEWEPPSEAHRSSLGSPRKGGGRERQQSKRDEDKNRDPRMRHPEGRVHGRGGQHHQDCPQMAGSRGPMMGDICVSGCRESQRFPSQREAAPAGPPPPERHMRRPSSRTQPVIAPAAGKQHPLKWYAGAGRRGRLARSCSRRRPQTSQRGVCPGPLTSAASCP